MQTEATFDVAVVADADTEEGEVMSIAFGSLPVGVESENPKVQYIYSEDVTFSFDEANHTVAEGDDIYIQIMLSHALSSEIEIPLEVRRCGRYPRTRSAEYRGSRSRSFSSRERQALSSACLFLMTR